jgi:uncharacterized membrane protein YGL010W
MGENELITTYSSSHQNKTNQLIHYFCVPIIFFNVVGFIYYLSPLWLTLSIVASTLVFYYRSMRSFFPLMIILYLFCLCICYFFATTTTFLRLNLIFFIVAWIGQFIGHKIEGKKPSFFQDLFFLMVGPAWVMKKLKTKLLS